MDKDVFMAAEQLKAVYEILGDFFDSPCNFGFGDMDMTVDEYMFERGGAWCEEHCGRVPDSACWQKFLELKAEDRKKCGTCRHGNAGLCVEGGSCSEMPSKGVCNKHENSEAAN